MKIKLDDKHKADILTGAIIALIAIAMYFFFSNFTGLKGHVKNAFAMLFPFIVGFVIAFLLNPLMMFIEKRFLSKWRLKKQTQRNFAAFLSLLIGLVVVVFFMTLIASQIRDSIEMLLSNYQDYLSSFQVFLEDVFNRFNLDIDEISRIINSGEDFITVFTSSVSKMAPQVLGAGIDFVMTMVKILIGVIAGLYLLMDKEKFLRQCQKINYAVFSKQIADAIAHFMIILKTIFYDFIVGKAIDSLIIGIICYVGMTLLGFEYVALISVIVGVCNMIPVFGPFIGAVPGFFLLLIINPIQSVYFLLFILVLQQFDGNFLGPLILGDKLGVPSFWILFSVTLGGSLFGVVGMFIGVPIFAAIYYLVSTFVNYRLKEKNVNIE